MLSYQLFYFSYRLRNPPTKSSCEPFPFALAYHLHSALGEKSDAIYSAASWEKMKCKRFGANSFAEQIRSDVTCVFFDYEWKARFKKSLDIERRGRLVVGAEH